LSLQPVYVPFPILCTFIIRSVRVLAVVSVSESSSVVESPTCLRSFSYLVHLHNTIRPCPSRCVRVIFRGWDSNLSTFMFFSLFFSYLVHLRNPVTLYFLNIVRGQVSNMSYVFSLSFSYLVHLHNTILTNTTLLHYIFSIWLGFLQYILCTFTS